MRRRTVDRDVPLVGYTLEEASAAMRTHPQTLARLFRQGDIPARKHGRGWLVHPDALEAWLKEGRKYPSQENECDESANDLTYTAISGEEVALDELRVGLLTIQEQITLLSERTKFPEAEKQKLQNIANLIGIYIPEAPPVKEGEAEDMEGEE